MKLKRVNKKLVNRVLFASIFAIFYTSRVIFKGKKYLPEKSGRRRQSIVMAWHGNMLIPIYVLRRGKYSLLIGLHSDAEVLNNFATYLGYSSIRGSSYRRPVGAVIDLFKVARRETIAMTPDGPRGPYRKLKPGTIKILQRIGAEIVPVGASASRKIVLKSWDKFEIPLPFSTIKIVVGKPFKVAGGMSLDALCRVVEERINEVQKASERFS